MPNRRAFLAGVGAASVPLAGCNGLFEEGPERRVAADWTPDAGEWAGPTYDLANSGHNPTATPPGEAPGVEWEVQARRPSVLVADGTVYVRESTTLRGFDADDGTEQFSVSRPSGDLQRYVDDRLYDWTEGGLAALSLDGEAVWEAPVSDEGPVSLLERDGYVFLSVGTGVIRRYHADTGESVGDAVDVEADVGGLANHDGVLYAALPDGVAAYDVADDGTLERQWRGRADREFRPRSTVVAVGDGLAVLGEIRRDQDGNAGLSAFSAFDVDGETHLGTVEFDRPALVGAIDDLVYVVTHREADGAPVEGEVHAYDGTERQWAVDLDPAPGWLVAADGRLYVGAGLENPQVTALDADGGEELWIHEGAFPHAVVGETVYAATDDDRLVALRE